MAVPQSKAELLGAINKTYARLVADLQALPTDLATQKSMPGHAQDTWMSVHDLVAYLVGWNELVLKWYRHKNAGERVDFPETGYKWNELGRLAQKFYDDFSDLTFTDLLLRLEAAKSAIIALIESETDEALYHQAWYEKWTLGRMIQFNTSSPYANARARLRKWLKTQ